MLKKSQLPGLNVYRAIAVILMILAHAARVQTGLPSLQNRPELASVFDWPFIASLLIEPVISAMFLFIAGFSLVLSLQASRETPALWLRRLGGRMLTLYAISVLFFLADRGVQWPDLLVSSGVLGIIAVAVFSSGLCLVSPRPWLGLALFTLAGLVVTAVLELNRWSVTGLNAGAGGMLPLLVLGWLGSLTGLVYRRWPGNGLYALLGISLATGLLALAAPYPWISHPVTSLHFYPGDRLQSVLYSLQDILGLYDGQSQVQVTRYWNHGWIFALRALPLLVLMLILLLGLIRKVNSPALGFLDWMGRQALNIYILHLILLALITLGPWQPASGWQTLLMVLGIVALCPLLLRYLSFVPLRLGKLTG